MKSNKNRELNTNEELNSMNEEFIINSWPLSKAKSKLSELIRASILEPQLISTDGKPSAVVLNLKEYMEIMKSKNELLKARRAKILKELIEINVADSIEVDFELPARVDRKLPDLD
jgi:prevent-host-death family protein